MARLDIDADFEREETGDVKITLHLGDKLLTGEAVARVPAATWESIVNAMKVR